MIDPFPYATDTHMRRHGPVGYSSYKAYKDWLRDEFAFRCVYCLFREKWYPNRADAFGENMGSPPKSEWFATRLSGRNGDIVGGGFDVTQPAVLK